MKFKVSCHKPKHQPRNPFIPGAVWGNTEMVVRTWGMECESEEEVRNFFKEAKEQDMPNVRGFTLRSITPMDTTEGE